MKTKTKRDTSVLDTIRKTVEKRGWSMKRLSDESGSPYQSVHRIIKGDPDPALSTVARLCRALGLDLIAKPTKRKG